MSDTPTWWVLKDPTDWWNEPEADHTWSDDESYPDEQWEDEYEPDTAYVPTHTPTTHEYTVTTTYTLGRHERTRTHRVISTFNPNKPEEATS